MKTIEKPQDVTENGEYIEPNTFESDREAVLFYSYIEQIKYIKHLEEQVSIAVEKALQVAAKEAKVKGIPIDEGGYLKIVDRDHILSLAPQILEELKGGEGDD